MIRRPPRQERENLLESAATAHRERDASGRIRPSPAWTDLDGAGRLELFQLQTAARQMERAADLEGLSTTARAVLSRLPRLPQLEPEQEE